MSSTCWRGAALLVGVLLLLAAPDRGTAQPTGLPDAEVGRLIDEGIRGGLDPALLRQVARQATEPGRPQAASLLRPAVRLARRDLPARHVLQKVLEGMAKGVPGARLAAALQRAERHTVAADAQAAAWIDHAHKEPPAAARIDRGIRHRVIVSAAKARMQGVPPRAVDQLFRAAWGYGRHQALPSGDGVADRVIAALEILAEVASAGGALGEATRLLSQAVQEGYGVAELREVSAVLRRGQHVRGVHRGRPFGRTLPGSGMAVGPPGLGMRGVGPALRPALGGARISARL
ncbi:MAG: hypothetical protein GVY35_18480 [Bacteroidetes bacterium]|nr:hypothetical protein [Bacteroidota bacterium]